jgi:hypothetical protein
MTSRRLAARSGPITSISRILAHVDDVLRRWPVAHRWRTTSPDVRWLVIDV